MKTFTDNAGRIWTIAINVATIQRVRASPLKLDLLDMTLVPRLLEDPVLIVNVVYVLCQIEANGRNITDEDFGRAMAGDAIEAATIAFLEDLTDFFPKGRREMLRRTLNKIRAAEPTLIQRLEATVNVDDLISQAIDQAVERSKPRIRPQQSGDRFGSSLESSESIPAQLHSDS